MGDKFCSKSSPNVYYFLGYIEKHNILVKTAVGIVWATFGRIWLLFISPSGHTEPPTLQKLPPSSGQKIVNFQNSRMLIRVGAAWDDEHFPVADHFEAAKKQATYNGGQQPAPVTWNHFSVFIDVWNNFQQKNKNVVYFTSLFSAYNCFSVTIKCFVLLCSQREKETLKRWRFSHIYIHVLSHQMIVGKISSRKITSKTRTWEKASIASLLLGNCLKPVSGTKKNIFGEIIFCFLVISSFLSFDLLLR